MSRIALALVATLLVAPEALACGMYMPELIALEDALDSVDGEVAAAEADAEAPAADVAEAVAVAEVLEAAAAPPPAPVEPAVEPQPTAATVDVVLPREDEITERRPFRAFLAKVGLRRDEA